MDQEPDIHKNKENECIAYVHNFNVLTLVPDFSISFNIGWVSLDNYKKVNREIRSKW